MIAFQSEMFFLSMTSFTNKDTKAVRYYAIVFDSDNCEYKLPVLDDPQLIQALSSVPCRTVVNLKLGLSSYTNDKGNKLLSCKVIGLGK